MKSLSFKSGEILLDAALFQPSNPSKKHPAILFVHGWTSEKERSFQYAESLVKLGYICFLFDMRGHGKSEGNATVSSNKDFLNDCIAAYDYSSQIQGVDGENISAVGSSFGGYLIALLSIKRKIKNLAMRVPADYSNESFNHLKKDFGGDNPEVMKWREKPKDFSGSFALEALHQFNGQILIIESEKDDRIPHQTIMNYVNAVQNPEKLKYVLMRDAPHSIPEGKFRNEVEQILVDWFRSVENKKK